MAQLITELTPPDDQGNINMNPVLWVKEAHELAQKADEHLPQPNANDVYILDSDNTYFDTGLPVVKSQLSKAGFGWLKP